MVLTGSFKTLVFRIKHRALQLFCIGASSIGQQVASENSHFFMMCCDDGRFPIGTEFESETTLPIKRSTLRVNALRLVYNSIIALHLSRREVEKSQRRYC